MKLDKKTRVATLLAFLLGMAASVQANEHEIYGFAGVPGLILGYGKPLGDRFAVRADVVLVGTRIKEPDFFGKTTEVLTFGLVRARPFEEDGVLYDEPDENIRRVGLFVDWFFTGGRPRFTAGVTFNNMNVETRNIALANGGSMLIGNTVYNTQPGDQFVLREDFRKVTPYFGFGLGHHRAEGPSVVFDVGVSFNADSRFSATASGPNLGGVSQADLNLQVAREREAQGVQRVIPQLGAGVSFRF